MPDERRHDARRAPLPMASASAAGCAIVRGEIGHTRHRPRRHSFRYDAFCLRLPLSQVDRLDALGIAHNRRGAIALHDADHGARDGSALLPWIRALLAAEGIAADGEVVLHTVPRLLGYVFNPISFWVCHDARGDVRAVLCEVSNTFGEHHNYLLAHADGSALASGETLAARKVFHVSPFCEVKGRYEFRFHFGAERWLARIDYFDGDDAGERAPLIATHIGGRATALDRDASRRLLRDYRFFTLAVVARIHWQAAKLWVKGVRFFGKRPPQLSTHA